MPYLDVVFEIGIKSIMIKQEKKHRRKKSKNRSKNKSKNEEKVRGRIIIG